MNQSGGDQPNPNSAENSDRKRKLSSSDNEGPNKKIPRIEPNLTGDESADLTQRTPLTKEIPQETPSNINSERKGEGEVKEQFAEQVDEILPAAIDDGTSQSNFTALPAKWHLDDAYCMLGQEKVTFDGLLRNYGITPVEDPFVPMDPDLVSWTSKRLALRQLIKSVRRKIPDFITETDVAAEKELFKEIMDTLLLNKVPTEEVNKFLPSLKEIGSWSTAYKSNLDPSSSGEQDFTVQIYAHYFEPFLLGLGHTACTNMPLPPPFENYIRRPDTRTFVNSEIGEFIFFIREDSAVRKDGQIVHKDLHKLVQLMRCALRLQTTFLRGVKAERELICFGILPTGYKLQLLQMRVELLTEEDYLKPKFQLFIDTELLDLDFRSKTPEQLSEIHQRMTRLFNWLSVIRSYGFYLNQNLGSSGDWKLNEEPQEIQTAKKIPMANARTQTKSKKSKETDDHESAKNNDIVKSDEDEDDDNGNNSFRDTFAEVKKELFPASSSQSKTEGGNTNEKKSDGMNEQVLAEIIDAITRKRYRVLYEGEYNKQVVAVCTHTERIRLFAVKIFGPNSRRDTREVEVMKMLGDHPHISQLLAAVTLKTGELLVVQPFYRHTSYPIDFKDSRRVFLQLAKGLERIHSRGVIHGDIKPSNFVLNEDLYLRIIDFDFSLRVGVDGRDAYVGTAGYRAPETADPKNLLTQKIDIWSLAITLFAGVNLCAEEEKPLKKRETILAHLSEPNCFWAPFRALFTKMLDLNPNNRPTASQVRQAIELNVQGQDYLHVISTPELEDKENSEKNASTALVKSPKKSARATKTVVKFRDISSLVK